MKQLFNLSLLLLALILPATASAYDFEVDGIYYSTNGNGDRLYCPVPYHADSDTIVKLNGQPHGIEIEEGAIINVGLSDNHKENPAYESVKNRCEEILDQFKGGVYQFHSATGHHLNAFYSESVTSPDDSTFVVSLPTSGTLINIIGTENVLKVKCLKVSGNLNGTDILAIRKMINLCVLDMADAHIVDGGASYYQNYTTSKDAIGEYFFNNLTNLSSIKLPSDLKTIKEYAFNEMTKLEEINIPDSVTSIGEKSFYNCIGLSIATIGKSVTSIGSTAFYGCNALTELHWNAISCLTNGSMPTNNLTIITIGDAVQILPDSFAKDSKITVISLSNSVTEIRYNAFLNCVGLTEITLPDNVTEIGSSAFEGCTGLSEVSIPNKVEIINSAVFKGCINIEHVTIGNHVKEINSQAFYACEKLDRIEIPSSVNEIYGEAFNGCTSLTEVLIHDGSGSISLIRYDSGHAPFYQCPIERLHLGKTIRTNSPWYGEHATTFSGMSTIKYLTIGNLVRLISSNSFNYCSGLIEVNIGSNVKTIGSNAFSDCSKLTSIIIPNSVTDINASAFSRCYELNNLVIGNSVSTIGDYAFSSCTELTSIDIPGSVTSIGNSTFAGCTALTEIYSYNTTPPAIQETTFDGATEQNAILHVPSGCRTIYWLNPYWENFGSIVEIDPVIATTIELEPTMAEIVQGNTLQLIATVRPDNTFNKKVTWISSNTSVATVDSTGLVKAVATGSAIITATTNDGSNLTASCSVTVTQPESSYITFADSNVKAICIQNWDTNGDGELSEGEAAAVTSLNNIFTNNSTIASFDELEYFTGLSSINDEDFSGCQGLTSVHIPNPIISIGDYAFNNCFQLKNVTIPNSVVTIGKSAFYQCCKLTSLTIPDSVTSIGQLAFAYCNGLSSLTIPASVTSIGRFAFTSSGSNLTSIRVSSDNQFYDSREDCNAIIETSTNTLLTGCMSTIIPNTVTAIGESAFANYYLLNSIHIPESVVSIGEQAFTCCSGLTSINIPNSVTTIGWYAFSSCTSLTSIEIPNSVTYIGGGAFKDCAGLNDVYSFISGPTTITMGDNVFYRSTNNYSGRALYVPFATANAYQADENWCPYFGSIVEMESIQDSIITFADAHVKALCVQNWDTNRDGELSMAEAAAVTTLGSVFRQNTTITSFDELKYFTGLTIIDHSFSNCGLLSNVLLPSSITAIGEYAFFGCLDLTGIVIPNSVTSIDEYAFFGCEKLVRMDIPNSVKTIGRQAFSACYNLKTITIGSSVTSIGACLFAGCNELDNITVDIENPVYDSREKCNAIIRTSSNSLIHGCKNTTIPNSVITIDNSAFWGAHTLRHLEIPHSVTSIKDLAIYNTGLTSLNLPNTVTYIGRSAFSSCPELTSIVVESGNPRYDSRENCNAIIETANNTLIAGCKNTVIPNTVTAIGDHAFDGCSNLTNIDIPNSVNSIGDFSFNGCTNLTDIILPNSINKIDFCAFQGCGNLTRVLIPNSVTSIGSSAFSNCTILNNVYSYIIDPSGITMGDNVFPTYPSINGRTLHVPFGTINAYQADVNWYPYFGQIVEMIPTTSIALNKKSAVLVEGETLQLTATVLPDSTTFKTVSWTTSNPAIATVDENGLVTAIAKGSATITATTTDGTNLCDSCMVTVTADLSEYDNYLSLSNVTAFRGDTIIIPVAMTNDASIISFQTDIFLPEGLEILQEDGEYIIDPSSRMTRTHSIMSNGISTGGLRVLCFSSNYKPFMGNSGDDLFYITVKVADDAEGDYIIQLKNTLLTNTEFVDLAAPDVAATVNVKAYLLGDANNSGTVTITDVVVTAQYVLEMNPSPFIFEAADVNFDNNITVADVSRIVWMVLNPTLNAPLRARAMWNNGDRMSGKEITLAAGETRTVSIMLDNMIDYSAFQFDLTLPDGLTAGNFALTDRAGSHAFDVNVLANGKTRALCYSPMLMAIRGNEGAVLTFDVTANGIVNRGILVDGIEMVTTDCQTVRLDAFAIGVNSATVLNEMAAGKTIAKVEYFNVAGQRLDRPDSGVTLVVTTYTDGTRSTTKVIK